MPVEEPSTASGADIEANVHFDIWQLSGAANSLITETYSMDAAGAKCEVLAFLRLDWRRFPIHLTIVVYRERFG